MENAQNVKDKLRDLRKRARFSMAALAEKIGIPESTYKHYEVRLKEPYLPIPFAEQLATAFAGTGITRAEVMELAGIKAVETTAPKNGLVPVFDVQASAGWGAIAEYETIAYSMAFPPGYLQKVTRTDPRNLVIISVKGDSMLPTLCDDDVVMIDTTKKNVQFDGMFVFRYGEALHIKRVMRAKSPGYIIAVSDNRALYDPVEYRMDEVEVIGRVIWYARRT
jgi:phage repressor protein C with HTH and peptisase S24 domain